MTRIPPLPRSALLPPRRPQWPYAAALTVLGALPLMIGAWASGDPPDAPTVAPAPGIEVVFVEVPPPVDRVPALVDAIEALARAEDCGRCDAHGLTRRVGGPVALAEAVLLAADAHGIDPLVLLAIAWRESRFDPAARGDAHLGGRTLSCGITQVRIDIRGRPTCEELADVAFALDWTADHLMRGDRMRLERWNGDAYALRVFGDVDRIRREVGR